MFIFESKDNIKGLDCSDTHIILWTNKKFEVHELVITPSKF